LGPEEEVEEEDLWVLVFGFGYLLAWSAWALWEECTASLGEMMS
jgi:hypothetical protein